MKANIPWWCFVSMLMAGLAGSAELMAQTDSQQIITLDDGAKLTLLGTTQGSYHVPPHFENLRTGNPIRTSNDAMVVWVKAEHDVKRWPSYELLVSDKANTACVNLEARSRSHVKDGVDIQGFVLDAFPRWEKETILRARPYQKNVAKGQFVITNPPPEKFASWTAESLPATKSDGDLEVTLKKLVTGVAVPHRQGQNRGDTNDPANQCVRVDFDFRQNGQATTNWHAWPVKLSDAAGNHARGLIYDYPPDGIIVYPPNGKRDGYFFQPGLWPDGPVWKVQMEFIQRSGFSEDEVVTFTNIPVRLGSKREADEEWSWNERKTNFAVMAEAKVNEVQLKLLPPLLVPDSDEPTAKRLRVVIVTDLAWTRNGMNLKLLKATDETGQEIYTPFSPAGISHFSIEFPRIREVKSLNLKLALHKSRFVEFTVKPGK